MNTNTYRILVEREGLYPVRVFKREEKNYAIVWDFKLEGDYEPVILKEFYTEARFAIVNWDGWIRLYDASTQTTLLDHKLNGKVNSSAVLSLDKSKLYVAYTDDSSEHHLAILNLQSYELETLALPDIYQKSMAIRKDGCLLFYKHDWERIDNKKTFKHFYSVLNLETQKINQFELAFAPQSSFVEFKPVVDIQNNRVIMPLYDDVSYKTNTTGEILFEYRIAFYDLNTFDITQVLSVRDFPKNQLGYFVDESEEMAELFLGSERNEDYTEMHREFSDNLNTIIVVEDSLWLCWHGGIVRKIRSDFTLSPLLATTKLPYNNSEGMFNQVHFHSHLYYVDNVTIILEESPHYYKAALPNLDGVDIEIPIPLTFEATSLEELYNLSYSIEKKKEIELRDFIKIEVTNLSTQEGMLDALTKIADLVCDLEAAGIGKTLKFVIFDAQKNTLQEPDFFAQAATIAPDRIQDILEKLMANNSIKYVYRNAEETVLCHAVFELAKKGDSYLNTTIKYLDAIDLDHDVFNTENLIPFLEETYSVEVLKKKTKAVSSKLGEWYEYYREEADL